MLYNALLKSSKLIFFNYKTYVQDLPPRVFFSVINKTSFLKVVLLLLLLLLLFLRAR